VRRVLVDTGALVALARESDAYHTRAVHFFGEYRAGELLTTTAVLTEAMHLLPARLGPPLLDLVQSPPWRVLDASDGLARIGELIRKYLDRPMDFADASLVWVAEQTAVLEILTTDQDFEIYRTRALRSLEPIDW
jgi:hypothetical protein